MKHSIRIVLFLWIGFVAAGCKKSGEESKTLSDDAGTVAERRENAIASTKEAAKSVQEFAYAQKDQFVDASKRELADIQTEMERLRTTIERSTGAARVEAEAKLKVVSDKWAAVKAQLDQAEVATEASWHEVQDRYRAAQTDLQRSFHDTREWLSERIEP